MAYKVKVLNDPTPGQRRGDWKVVDGRRLVSRHRTKTTAVDKAEQKARAKNKGVSVQRTDGTWQDHYKPR
jgi:hypothetical protein